MTGSGESADLNAARGGDRAAFDRLVAPYRDALHAHCYRMLGLLEDADDAVQETLLRAWRSLSGFEGRSSLRTWLLRIATNVSLSMAQRRPPRLLPLDHGPAAEQFTEPPHLLEQPWLGPYPDPGEQTEQREFVRLAFVAALQLLPANERAALLMRDVLAFSAAETAQTLDTTSAAVNSALQRARRLIAQRAPSAERASPTTDAAVTRLVAEYADAMDRGDVARIVSLLADDATWSMPPVPEWFTGHESIARFLPAGPFQLTATRRIGSANGQPAVAAYSRVAATDDFEAFALDVLTVADGRISSVVGFLGDIDYERFGLPRRVTVDRS